jgi:hypothetical protein
VLAPGHRGRHEDSWGRKFTEAKPDGPTGGVWNVACDSYGRVQHSKKACVYTKVQGPTGGDLLVTVAARIENWQDAKLIAAAPAMRATLTAVLHQMKHGEASDALDLGIFGDGTQGDLRWCREEIEKVLNSLS